MLTIMWVAGLIFVAILLLLAYLDTRKPRNFPPGPSWWPVVGSALAVNKLRKQSGYLYEATAELGRRYGPVVGVRVGKDRQVVLCSYRAIREMLTREEFDGRPQGPFYETRTWGVRRGVLLTDEEFWQEQRRFVLRHLREFGFGRRTMAELVEAEAGELVAAMRSRVGTQETGAVVAMHDVFGVYVLNTLWSMLAGIRYSADDLELKRLQGLLTELFANIDMVGCLFSQFPMLRFIAPELSGYKQFIYIHQKVWEFLKAELDKHKATFKPDQDRDFMDVYLKTLLSDNSKTSFSESQLLAICMDMFMAGSETTSKSLGFGFLYLLLYPEVQRKAQKEIDAVVGRDRLPRLSDRPNMPYMEACMLESVRMFMGRTFSIPHRALKDTELLGYSIPKDTMVICNFHCTLMDKEIWGDPEAFRPERFIDAEGKVVIPEEYTPFGFGKHRCMGETLAKSNVFIFMSSLLQNFNFEVPPNQVPPSTDAIDGVTPSPRPYSALVKLRS
ncbi:probable cytochrome P450 303a1 [Schistocerca piceifrons]|uniref:probable cytochrome P450 303a1 n=1 Tax=Schistocerca piceifrons TaxID=274613 RepID=UPI001F5F91EF|nr:probable cytochrome P450 303a1 [Schistocerca piceifrons]